eukprot:scaffold271903_cov27-Tisochrysis_lutea.AAC.2
MSVSIILYPGLKPCSRQEGYECEAPRDRWSKRTYRHVNECEIKIRARTETAWRSLASNALPLECRWSLHRTSEGKQLGSAANAGRLVSRAESLDTARNFLPNVPSYDAPSLVGRTSTPHRSPARFSKSAPVNLHDAFLAYNVLFEC